MKLPPRLAALVVKDGVSLGLLAEADRALVLALAAAAIEAGREHREADMNRILEAWLEGPGAMLRTDQSNCDAGWWMPASSAATASAVPMCAARPRRPGRPRFSARRRSAALEDAVLTERAARAAERAARRQAYAMR